MKDHVYDDQGHEIATVRDGALIDPAGQAIGTVRNDNVYDRNGKFIFHLLAADSESAGRMTGEAVQKLLHPKH